MADSTTTTTVTTLNTKPTTKPQLKLTVPSLTKSQTEWEDLFMADPGDEFDKHQTRLDLIDQLLDFGKLHRVYRKMKNWRNNPVFDDDDDDEEIMMKVGSEDKTTNVDDDKVQVQGKGKIETKRTDSALDVRDQSKNEDVSMVEDKGVMCTSQTSLPPSPLSTWAKVSVEAERKAAKRKEEKGKKPKKTLDEFDDLWKVAWGVK